MELSWSVEHESGVSLVRCRLHNDAAVPRRVRLRSRLDGPVLPPRRGGVPEPGWDADGATVRLDPGERRALGFATPAPSVEPPVEIDVTDPSVTDPGESDGDETFPPATAVVRDMGSYRPPRDAVLEERTDVDDADSDDTEHSSVDVGPEESMCADDPVGSTTGEEPTETATANEPGGTGTEDSGPVSPVGAIDTAECRPDPECVVAWLDAVERRVERGERLTDADVQTATKSVARVDGIDAIAELDDRLVDDTNQLRRVEDRITELAARAERVDVPVDALRRLS